MKRSFLLSGLWALCVLFGSITAAYAQSMSGMPVFSARLTGDQEVPAVSTSAHGVASITFSADMQKAYLNMHVNGLSGAIQGVHIHEAPAGTNGSVVVNLQDMIKGNHLRGTVDMDRLDMRKLVQGMYYLNVHTPANPDGEIRGQIMLERDKGFQGWLSGAEEVPAVTTNAYGLATARLDLDRTNLHVMLRFRDLSSAVTGGHLHYGAKGMNGPVVINLNLTPVSTGAMTSVDLSTLADPDEFIDSLMMGHVYVNVHTLNNTGGEIRTQLMPVHGFAFDAMLDGSQEVPAVVTTAQGLASIRLSPDMDTLMYDAVLTDLSGAVTGAHFHRAMAGENGGVVVNLTTSVNGNRIQGMVTGDALTHRLIKDMMMGHIYLNVHTAANPAGEIRGQVYKYARDGYVLLLNGGQEVPAVNVPNAMGAGIVTIDRDRTNAHFMSVWSGLTGAVTGVHFHSARPGTNGGVVLDLNPYLSNNAVYGFWNDASFTAARAEDFMQGRMYLNVHTAANSSGEIRGNVVNADQLSGMPVMANPGFAGNIVLSARINGSQEVPVVMTPAQGVAGFVLSEDMNSMQMNMTVTGLGIAVSGAHIHEGARGENGDVILDLDPYRAGYNVDGQLSGTELDQDNLLEKMISGETYVNFHTAANPNGAIRGQIMPEQDHVFYGMLSGDNEVPSVTTNAYGLAVASISLDEAKLRVHAVVQDLSSDITGAHLHLGKAGENGNVVVDLGPYRMGNQIMAELDMQEMLAAGYELFSNDSIYINVHTANHPNGEIRAQLTMADGIAFGTWLDAQQETVVSVSPAKGLGVFVVNPAMDMIEYHVVMDNLSGAATGAHFHGGMAGTSGGVLIDLSSGISNNMISGTVGSSEVTKAFLGDMLNGNVYINVHSAAYPEGEIRGQVYTYLRDGYVFTLCGGQEVPEVSEEGFGTAVVSIGRELDNIHYMIAIDSLTGAITGAHFHAGAMGTNGGPIHEITASFNSGMAAYGFWNDTMANPFDSSVARDIQQGEIYVNVHTANNVNGEVRGQVIQGSNCELSDVADVPFAAIDLSAYPQPFHEQLNLNISTTKAGMYQLRITDMTGRTVTQQNMRLPSGASYISIPAQHWSGGLYMLNLNINGTAVYSGKVMKQ